MELLAQPGLPARQLREASILASRAFLILILLALLPAIYQNFFVKPGALIWLYISSWVFGFFVLTDRIRTTPSLKLSLVSAVFLLIATAVIVSNDGRVITGMGFSIPAIVIVNIVYGTRIAMYLLPIYVALVTVLALATSDREPIFIVTGSMSTIAFNIFTCFFVAVVLRSMNNSRKQLQEALAEYDARARLGRVALFTVNVTRDIYEVNSVYRELMDVPEDEFPVLGVDLLKTRVANEQHPMLTQFMDPHLLGAPGHEIEWQIVRRDGSRRFVKAVLEDETLPNGDLIYKGAIIDQTDAVTRQMALEDQRARQTRMFSIIAHELRTPAAAIRMLADDEAIYSESFSEVQVSADHLLQVIDDLRQAVNPEEETLVQLAPFSPRTVLAEAARQTQALASRTGLQIQVAPDDGAADTLCLSDAYRIRSILTNLLRNACYHSGGSRVLLTLHTTRVSDSRALVEFRVEDDGKGIEQEELPRLFEAFERGDTKASGTGVGLFLVRSWAQKLDGEIRYSESPLGGACFSVSFDLAIAESNAQGPDQAMLLRARELLEQKTVLMIEDDAMLRRMQQRLLEKNFDIRLCVAEQGQEALRLHAERPADLIITDYFMPELNGAELIRELRRAGDKVPVVALTAATIGEEQKDLYEAGADSVIAKPLDIDTLSAVIVGMFDR